MLTFLHNLVVSSAIRFVRFFVTDFDPHNLNIEQVHAEWHTLFDQILGRDLDE